MAVVILFLGNNAVANEQHRQCLEKETQKARVQITSECLEQVGNQQQGEQVEFIVSGPDPNMHKACVNHAMQEAIGRAATVCAALIQDNGELAIVKDADSSVGDGICPPGEPSCSSENKPNDPAPKPPEQAKPNPPDNDQKDPGKLKPKPEPTPPAKPTQPSISTAQIEGDLASCRAAQSNANTCCNNPMACAGQLNANDQDALRRAQTQLSNGPAAGQTMAQYCAQLQSLSQSSGNINNGFASVCSSNQFSCSNTCGSLAQKYRNLLNDCGSGCSNRSALENAFAQLSSSQSSCQSLRLQSAQLAGNGIMSAQPSAASQYCNQQLGNPQSLAGAPGTANPNALDPYNQYRQGLNDPTLQKENLGQSGFGDEGKDKTRAEDFNVPDMVMPVSDPALYEAKAYEGGTVPNNTGGGVPGQWGGAAPAIGNRRGQSPGNPGYTTDILQGNRSGGYSQPAGGGGGYGNDEQYRAYARIQQAKGDPSKLKGLDLKAFLPGGDRDPSRRIAGHARSSEIASSEADMWKKITNKMFERCRLGKLWECQ